jgi:2-polyprenyl-3-methyl-5-hydroxy-6-metoxy-1,4-benzoquinol methylase
MKDNVIDQWREALSRGDGYKHKFINCKESSKANRVWKRILKIINKNNSKLKFFDIGSGGGQNVVMLAMNKHSCVGIDISEDVINRSKDYINVIKNNCGDVDVKVYVDNIFELNILHEHKESCDVVYHFGVIEHFLEDEERILFLENMMKLLKPGGYVVSVVPSGSHPLRERQQKESIWGYLVPEVNYNYRLMFGELESVSLENIKVLPHSMFTYLTWDRSNKLKYLLRKIFFLSMQLVPIKLFSNKFSFKHCGSVIGIGRKPL